MDDIIERIREAFRHDTFWDTDAPPLLENAVAEIERLRGERRWIPLSEHMPEMGVMVMIGNAPYQWVGIGELVLVGDYLHWEDGDGEDLHEPTHWMPLHEPPEVK